MNREKKGGFGSFTYLLTSKPLSLMMPLYMEARTAITKRIVAATAATTVAIAAATSTVPWLRTNTPELCAPITAAAVSTRIAPDAPDIAASCVVMGPARVVTVLDSLGLAAI